MERLTFLSIFQSNLDEFFMVRVGSLEDQKFLKKEVCDNKTGMTSEEQIHAIAAESARLCRLKDATYQGLMDEVGCQGFFLTNFQEISEKEEDYLHHYFLNEILPLLSVMIVGRKQPFPFLRNKEIYAMAVLETKSDKKKIGIIPCSSQVFPRLIKIPTKKNTYMLSEELILHFLPRVFHEYKVVEKTLLRITRNADITVLSTDSGDGLTAAIRGECDLAMSSRSLKDYETELLTAETIGMDAIVLVVNGKNPISNVTMKEIKSIYDGKIRDWSEL